MLVVTWHFSHCLAIGIDLSYMVQSDIEKQIIDISMPSPNSQQTASLVSCGLDSYGSAEIEKSCDKSSKNLNDDKNSNRPRIQFNPKVAVRQTIHVHDYSDEELSQSWYKSADFRKMKQEYAHTVHLLSMDQYPGDTDEQTSRGLEYRHKEGASLRRSNKLNALYAVLDEQERQWRERYDSDDELRVVYTRLSTKCTDAARMLGRKDEEQCRLLNSSLIDQLRDKYHLFSLTGKSGSDLSYYFKKSRRKITEVVSESADQS
jgi:hypothetical protein